jgi:transposase-like protein
MVTVKCLQCGGDRLVRNGLTQNSKRYLCSDCGRHSREKPQPNGYTE